MRREVIFVLILLMGFSVACDDSQRIMRLYSASNSHGAIWSYGDYSYEICYDDIFGFEYMGANPHDCNDLNRVVSLFSEFNSHASTGDDYSVEVCYGDLSCGVYEGSCSSGVAVARLSEISNAHISAASVEDYNFLICCATGGVVIDDEIPEDEELEVGDIYWANMNGEPIVEADLGDSVLMVVRGVTFGKFEIFDDDSPGLDDDIKVGEDAIEGKVNVDGNYIAIWNITEEDLDKAKNLILPENYEKFYFKLQGENIDEKVFLKVNIGEEIKEDDPIVVNLTSPECGSYYDVGQEIIMSIEASDADDVISGNITVAGKRATFTNEKADISNVFDEPGNFQIVVEAVNTKGKRSRMISNIMILDKVGEYYQDGDYVAACIKEPKDFAEFYGDTISFDASTTRGIRIVENTPTLFVPGEQNFNWNWRFFMPNGSQYTPANFADTIDRLGFEFTKRFPVVGDNSASLTVDIGSGYGEVIFP